MIDINQLRLGNWLLLHGKPEYVWGIDLDLHDEYQDRISIGKEYDMHPVCWINGEDLKYIPLTPEEMIRLSFVKLDDTHFTFGQFQPDGPGNISVLFTKRSGIAVVFRYEQDDIGFNIIDKVKYVHQLQNTYHALAGVDLVFDHRKI